MCSQDNVLKDCFKFFETASKMFRFHDELIFRLKQEKQSFEKGSLDVSASRCNEAVPSSEAYPKITIHSGASQFSSTESIDEENSSSECTSDSSVSSLDSDLQKSKYFSRDTFAAAGSNVSHTTTNKFKEMSAN